MSKYTNDEIKHIFHPKLKEYFGKRGLLKLHWNVFSSTNQGILTLRVGSDFKKYEEELIKIIEINEELIDKLHILNRYILEHIYHICPELQNEYIIIYVTDSKFEVFDLTYTSKFGVKRNVNCFACYKNFKVINKI